MSPGGWRRETNRYEGTDDPAHGGVPRQFDLQLTAFFTSLLILPASVAVNSFKQNRRVR